MLNVCLNIISAEHEGVATTVTSELDHRHFQNFPSQQACHFCSLGMAASMQLHKIICFMFMRSLQQHVQNIIAYIAIVSEMNV